MLPLEFFDNVNDPVLLHDARIQAANTNEAGTSLTLHGDDNGFLRVIEIQYDCFGLTAADFPEHLLKNNPECDLMCHEFICQNDYLEHHILFADGTEILIQFNSINVNAHP